jgi:hypothetical protein
MLAGAGRFDGRVQRQQVGLVGDIVDDADFLGDLRIAATVERTASPPSPASCAALPAMPSVTLAFSVFCAIEADICSIAALDSSAAAACSLAPATAIARWR